MSSSKRNDYSEQALEAHKKYGSKFPVQSKMPLDTHGDLSIAYTPGVAKSCSEIAEDTSKAYDYTWKKTALRLSATAQPYLA